MVTGKQTSTSNRNAIKLQGNIWVCKGMVKMGQWESAKRRAISKQWAMNKMDWPMNLRLDQNKFHV